MQCKWAEELYWSFQYHGIWAAWLEKQLHTPKCTHHGKWYTLRFDNQSDGFPVSLQTMWAEETAAEGTWRMGTCLDGTEWETHSRTESFMLRFPVYCLRSVVHLRHENLNIAMIPWWGAGCFCRALSEILLLFWAWQLVRAGAKDVPLESKVFSTFFSVWKDSVFFSFNA